MTLRQDQQQPLTRRQLRELEKAQQRGAEGEQQVPPVSLPFSSDPAPAPAELRPTLSEPQPDAEPVAEAPKPPAPQTSAAPVVPLTRRQLRALQQASEGHQVPIAEVPQAEASAPVAAAPSVEPIVDVPISALPLPQNEAAAPPVIATAPAPEPAAAQVSSPEVIADAPQGPVTGQVRAFQPPTGHWSLAGEQGDDDVTSSTGSISASNALIMPIVPSAADVTGPLNATGEILLTGSIDLPRGLGSTGQVQGRFDGNDIDHMLDQNDRDARPDSGVEPVAATRAISTHAPSVSPNIVPPRKTSHKVGAIVGSVVGGVAALGVAGVLVAGFVFHAF
ncbi:hypothetical protein ACFOYW_05825 [Gryllotalpicola reticulitermitis]|uniref:Uncharacterized protein n=1 Tax=Gryllotalpicola reticulitermitis TaxID=1184153 RepID=A0ABV8Q5F2_9MICO